MSEPKWLKKISLYNNAMLYVEYMTLKFIDVE